MTTPYERAASFLAEILAKSSLDELAQRLRPKPETRAASVPRGAEISPQAVDERWAMLPCGTGPRKEILDPHTASQMSAYARNIEHFIGTVKVPIGVIGPLRVNGLYAQGNYYIPLATTEAALVASYGRGASVIADAGGASAVILNERVGRAPAFIFANLEEVGRFMSWVLGQRENIQRAAESTTRFGKLVDLRFTVEANHVYVLMLYETGDAAGQNMATIATDAAVKWLLANSPVKPRSAYIEANLSGDKKASAQSLQGVRGKKVTAEVVLPSALVQRRLHATPAQMEAYSRVAGTGGVLSGTLGVQGHYANGLAALFIACGQDAACVSEAATGVTRFELTQTGDLYVSVTLPNLIVGTVGGGTKLPSQHACLEVLGLAGPDHARALAEVAACVCLAGEISIVAAISAGEFVQAHVKFARGKEPT
ncbi:MAG: 3-hydroxy-3-methylglutaryl-CoA reductase [Thiotrichales bacterium SG8_50]|nr:MAG: 3-hydroxy-3-methylglutaryl-CoA reductase [Thiotrichales bacterium SG8_50]